MKRMAAYGLAILVLIGAGAPALASANLNASKSNRSVVREQTIQGAVTSVSDSSFGLRTIIKSKSNITNNFTVVLSTSTRVVDRTWQKIPRSDITVGDKVRVFGTLASTTITAQVVRDITLPRTAAQKQTTACQAACQRSCGANASCLTECYANCRSGSR